MATFLFTWSNYESENKSIIRASKLINTHFDFDLILVLSEAKCRSCGFDY